MINRSKHNGELGQIHIIFMAGAIIHQGTKNHINEESDPSAVSRRKLFAERKGLGIKGSKSCKKRQQIVEISLWLRGNLL